MPCPGMTIIFTSPDAPGRVYHLQLCMSFQLEGSYSTESIDSNIATPSNECFAPAAITAQELVRTAVLRRQLFEQEQSATNQTSDLDLRHSIPRTPDSSPDSSDDFSSLACCFHNLMQWVALSLPSSPWIVTNSPQRIQGSSFACWHSITWKKHCCHFVSKET